MVTVDYTGNGGGQTIDFAGEDHAAHRAVRHARDRREWCRADLVVGLPAGRGIVQRLVTNLRAHLATKGKFQVAHVPAGTSYNANGVNYIAIALFDPSGRYVLPFAVSKPTAEDNYTQYLRYPQSGELASLFIPDFVFGGVANGFNGGADRGEHLPGPGTRGRPNREAGRGAGVGSQPYPGDWRRYRAIRHPGRQRLVGDQAFWAGRVSDGVSSTRLMAVTVVHERENSLEEYRADPDRLLPQCLPWSSRPRPQPRSTASPGTPPAEARSPATPSQTRSPHWARIRSRSGLA